MPTEIRQIILNEEEILLAVASYRRVREDIVPAGDVHWVMPAGGGKFSIEVVSRLGGEENRKRVTVDNPIMVEALTRFYIENNIIVPDAGRRLARYSEKGWFLEVMRSGEELDRASIAKVADGASFDQVSDVLETCDG